MTSHQQIVAATPWIPNWHETGACMDRRHILWLYRAIVAVAPQSSLEIGVHTGASSSAFLHAKVPNAHFCDITSRECALRCIEGRGIFHSRPGWEVLRDRPAFDFVLVDGNHSEFAVGEEWEQLRQKPPAVIAVHDVNSTVAGFGACEGAHRLWENLQRDGWLCVVDAQRRPHEMTHRGALIATRDPQKYALIRQAWESTL